MPVIFNEPLSFIQRIAEYMEYYDLLMKAADEPDPAKRLEVLNTTIVGEKSCLKLFFLRIVRCSFRCIGVGLQLGKSGQTFQSAFRRNVRIG